MSKIGSETTPPEPGTTDASANQSRSSTKDASQPSTTNPNIEILRMRQDAALKREEIQADVKKVVYGTFLLGVAVALFPVISGYIEHDFNLRIENTKQVHALALQANQLNLDLQKLERENQLAVEAARSATEQSDRSFFEAISDEARSARLSDRITIAEFFAFVARDDTERKRWADFLEHLKGVQTANNTRRAELLEQISEVNNPMSQREAAARELAELELDQIDQRESGVAPVSVPSKWEEQVPIPNPASMGMAGLSDFRVADALALFGEPHSAPNRECQKPDNPRLIRLIETRNVGPFSTTLIVPALASLERVMAQIKETQPDLYSEVGSAGGLCVRLVRGSNAFSGHSWGTSIDITIGGQLDRPKDTMAQAGLVELARYFAQEGWFWGSYAQSGEAFHFEVSAEKLAEWNAAGLLTPSATNSPEGPDAVR